MYTKSINKKAVTKNWLLINAKDLVLGRLSSIVAMILKGKNKPFYTPNVDCGDNVIIVNAKDVFLTGKKAAKTMYYKHTGYPGGIKEQTMGQKLANTPESLIKDSVRLMLAKGPLRNQLMKNLYVYKEGDHPHNAQNPVAFDISSLNRKNTRQK